MARAKVGVADEIGDGVLFVIAVLVVLGIYQSIQSIAWIYDQAVSQIADQVREKISTNHEFWIEGNTVYYRDAR
jgi:hypothetical protein